MTHDEVDAEPWFSGQKERVHALITRIDELERRLTFDHFREVNVERAKSFPSAKQNWTSADWLVAMMGEVGELAAVLPEDGPRVLVDNAEMMKRVIAALGIVCNTMKKLRRGVDYTKGKTQAQLQSDLETQMLGLKFWFHRLQDALGVSDRHVGPYPAEATAVLDRAGSREGEVGDVQTYLDLLANSIGVRLGDATVKKFNEVSERVGAKERL